MPENLETKCKKAVLRIADVVEEMNIKLCHIIETFKDLRNNFYRSVASSYYNQPQQEYRDYQQNDEDAC